MLWLNQNKIMSHYIVVIISSFWLKCICDFPFSKVNPQSGILKNISLPLLWLPSSRSGSVSLDLEGDLPPTRKRWSPEPEKEASISFSQFDTTEMDGNIITRTDWMRMDLAIPWREKTRSATARIVSGNVFSCSGFSWREIPSSFSWGVKVSTSTSFNWSSNQASPDTAYW